MIVAILSALWLGVLTSISPCPLASNIAALAFVEHDSDTSKKALTAGAFYALGRVFAYVVLSTVLAWSLLSAPGISQFLQSYILQLLGPLLILVGCVLLDLLPFSFNTGVSVSAGLGKRIRAFGILGAFVLGVIFALAFCPISAVIFFGSLLPLALEQESVWLMPAIYGLGTAAPVVVFAFIVSFARERLSSSYSRAQQLSRVMKTVTGFLILVVGLYLTVVTVF